MGSAAAGLIGLSLLFIAIVCRMGWGIKTKAFASLPRTVIVVLIMPGLLMSASFYALAMHMHSILGGSFPTFASSRDPSRSISFSCCLDPPHS